MFDIDPNLRPKLLPSTKRPAQQLLELSKQQEKQIVEIFNLFDTDGGGFIDRRELNFALVALGFKNKQIASSSGEVPVGGNSVMSDIIADGEVSVDEFTALMKGELSGKDPWEELRAAFALLSKDDGNAKHRDLITFEKLVVASKAFKIGLSIEEMQAMINEVDHDGGGTVDFDEYERILRSSAWY
jgi:calcium-binding protein CML